VQLSEAPDYPRDIVSGLTFRNKKNCRVSFSSPFSIGVSISKKKNGVSAHAMIVLIILWRVASDSLLGLFMN